LADGAARYLYLARHGEALSDESGLTEAGRQQAVLLGQRLRDRGLSAVYHGPLPRAAQTARIVGKQLAGVPLVESAAAGDYIPYVPHKDELPENCAGFLLRFLSGVTPRGGVLGTRPRSAGR
jgi:probable phosphoglycerate mutase